MGDLVTQFVLARRDDDGGWIQLLVLVVFAAIYALRGLLKAKGAGANDSSEAKRTAKPTYTPRAGRGATSRTVPRQSRPRPGAGPPPAQPRPQRKAQARRILRPVQAPPPLPETKKETPLVSNVQLPDLAAITSSFGQGDLVEPAAATAGPRVEAPRAMALESGEDDYLADILADYADPEQLRAAILHYEILGKPISLRDPSHQVIGP